MSVNTRKGPIFDPGLCRCCGAIKKCRLLNVEYEWNGQKEIYSDMFVDCFGLLLSHLDGEAAARLICATCVCRLRDAAGFRGQVLRCEERLLARIHGTGNVVAAGRDGEAAARLICATCVCRLRDAAGFRGQVLRCEERLLARIHGTDGESNEVKLEVGVKEELANVDVVEPVAACTEYDDDTHHAENDIEENTLPPSSKTRRKSPRQKLKRSKKKKTLRTESAVAVEMEHLDGDETLVQFQEYNLQEQKPSKQNGCRADNPKLNNDILTIIENSYVCPFDTSFSDYFCIYCREVFTDPQKLRDHTMTHDPTTLRDVLKNTSTNKKLQIDIYRIDCRLCPEQISDLEHLKLHSSIHGKTFGDTKDCLKFKLTPGKLSCTECDATFGFFHALKKHMAEHFGTCICDVCGAHYFEERMLLLHQKTHQNAKAEESFPCAECGKSFKSKYTRHIHTARTHTREAAYQCSKCDEEFFSYTLRYRHMMAAHGEQRTFPCEQCERAYDSRKSLREHNRRYHLKILKHQCELCDKRFYLPSRLKEHMASHTGERNFRCERCGKSYPRLRGLKAHLQSHAPHARHPCAQCGAAFAHAANLATHVRRHHPPAPAPTALQ